MLFCGGVMKRLKLMCILSALIAVLCANAADLSSHNLERNKCCSRSEASGAKVVYNSKIKATLTKLQQDAIKANIAKKPIGEVMGWVALQLLNKPYTGFLLDKTTPEYLYVSLDDTDCMLFIEEVLAVSRLIKQNTLTLDGLTKEIKLLRYHGDVTYCARNHYFKDWVSVNISKGFVSDEGYALTKELYPYKANILSELIMQNRRLALHKNNEACIKVRENYINSQEKLGFIPLKQLPKYLTKIHTGDIIGIVRDPRNADGVHHLGIAYVESGVVKMIDASSIKKEVVVEPSLMGYLSKFHDALGIVLIRAHTVIKSTKSG